MFYFSWQLEKRWGWLLFTSRVLGLLSGGFCVFVLSVNVKEILDLPLALLERVSGQKLYPECRISNEWKRYFLLTHAVGWIKQVMELFFLCTKLILNSDEAISIELSLCPFDPLKKSKNPKTECAFRARGICPFSASPLAIFGQHFYHMRLERKFSFFVWWKPHLIFLFSLITFFFLACKYFTFRWTNWTCFKIRSGSAPPAKPCQACEKPNECAGSLILWWRFNSSGLNF